MSAELITQITRPTKITTKPGRLAIMFVVFVTLAVFVGEPSAVESVFSI